MLEKDGCKVGRCRYDKDGRYEWYGIDMYMVGQ